MQHSPLWLVGFGVFVLLMLVLDLGVFHRRAHEVRIKEAILWSVFWIALALAFNLGILGGWFGGYAEPERALRAKEFLVAYVLEKSLSVDNLFVFAVLFTYFAVPAQYQHRTLFYGIVGALLLRAVFILTGVWLIQRFEWVLYVFAVFLAVTGVKMLWAKGKEIHPERNPVVRLARKLLPITDAYDGQRFFVRRERRVWATPLLLVLLFIETTDVVFAVDSVPAVLLVTQDPFIAYTSNVFAILGLRALYFALAGFLRAFHYLTYGLAVILIFIAGKMFYQEACKALFATEHKIPMGISLGVIVAILAISVLLSVLFPARQAPQPDAKA